MSFRVPPVADNPEPVYIYQDPTLEPIALAGMYLDQKGVGRIRTIRTTPEDMDRLCQTPMLQRDSNLDYAQLHQGGAIVEYQRNLDTGNMQNISAWWDDNATLSPNPPLIWLPGGITPAGFDHPNNGNSQGQISPATWAVDSCACGADATQYNAAYAGFFFDACRNCGWNGRPGMIIDGQHRIRGMAERIQPSGQDRHAVQIFVSMVIQAPPNAISQRVAARMFIEINGGANALEREHKDYLSSHFGILEFSTVAAQNAYELAVNLNIPGGQPHDEWWEDTGGRSGRVSMLEKKRMDFVPAFRITDWYQAVVGRTYDVKDIGGATSTAVAYPAATAVTALVEDFSNYLYAATAVWPGAGGVRGALPTWSNNRAAGGDLQDGAVIRTLLNLLPIFHRRINERGAAPNAVTFQEELRLISNIVWSGNWNSGSGWLKGDSGIGRVTKVLSALIADYPNTAAPAGPGWATLSTWFGGNHDPFTISNFTADTVQITFETATVCSIQTSITTPSSLIGAGAGFVELRRTPTGGSPGAWVTVPVKLKPVNTVQYPPGFTPAPGDVVELRVSTSTALNDTQVRDTATIGGAPISTVVIP
jgi:hypothetical protein